MRMQDTAANCGPASLSNALKARGIERTQAECETACGTTATDGTSVKALIRGIKSFGHYPSEIKAKKWEDAWLRLDHYLRNGHPVLLCVDGDSHWVAAIGKLGPQYLIADPADNELVLSLSPEALKTRWAHNKSFYGVSV